MKKFEFGYYKSSNHWFVFRGPTSLLKPIDQPSIRSPGLGTNIYRSNLIYHSYDLRGEVLDWLKENCNSWDRRNPTVCINHYIELWFKEEQDALHFGLKWL